MNSDSSFIAQLVHVLNILRPSHPGILYVSPTTEAFYFKELSQSYFGLLMPKWQMLEMVPLSVHKNDETALETFVRSQPAGNLFFASLKQSDGIHKFVSAILDGTDYKTGDDAFASYKGGDAGLLLRRQKMIEKAFDQALNGSRRAVITDKDLQIVIDAAIQRLDVGRTLMGLKEIGMPKEQFKFIFNKDDSDVIKNLHNIFDIGFYIYNNGSHVAVVPYYKLPVDNILFPKDSTQVGDTVADGITYRGLGGGKILIPYLKERKAIIDADSTITEEKKAEMTKLLEQAKSLPHQKLYNEKIYTPLTTHYNKVILNNGGAYVGDKKMEAELRSEIMKYMDQSGGGAIFGGSETSEPGTINLDSDIKVNNVNELVGGAVNENLSEEFFKEIMAIENTDINKQPKQPSAIPFNELYGGAMKDYDDEMSLSDAFTAQKDNDSKRRKFIFRKD